MILNLRAAQPQSFLKSLVVIRLTHGGYVHLAGSGRPHGPDASLHRVANYEKDKILTMSRNEKPYNYTPIVKEGANAMAESGGPVYNSLDREPRPQNPCIEPPDRPPTTHPATTHPPLK